MAVGFDSAALAIAYRQLVLWFGAQLVFGSVSLVVPQLVGDGIAATLVGLLLLATSLALAVGLVIYAYRTAVALGSTVGWLWGLAMLVPLVNAITLLVLSAKATRMCKAHGVPVGFFGPKIPTGAS